MLLRVPSPPPRSSIGSAQNDDCPPPFATAVVVAAGRGERLGVPTKVLLPVAGQPILGHVLDAIERASSVGSVILVVAAHSQGAIEQLVAVGPWTKIDAIVLGGEQRQHSVAAGVTAVSATAEVIVIHDGARPLAPPALFDRCATAAAATGAAIAAVPVADTLKRVDQTRIVATVDRAGLWAAQTPQAFRRTLLVDVMARGVNLPPLTDEASLCEALGIPVHIVLGSPANLKVTHPEDVPLAEALLRTTADPTLPLRPSATAAAGDDVPDQQTMGSNVRTGVGYDVHPFTADRPLVLGGVVIPHALGLAGHSDADALLHAIADALLGGAALGDIGQHFPPSDPRFKDADSRELLAQVGRLVAEAGYTPVNVDATVIAEAPRIAPHVAAMRTVIASSLHIAMTAVNVKATTNEGMGFVGRGEGIAALAIATLVPLPAQPA